MNQLSAREGAPRGIAFVLALAVLVTWGSASAQQSLQKLLEPSRFALIIGNANYGEHGNLPTLGSPCPMTTLPKATRRSWPTRWPL